MKTKTNFIQKLTLFCCAFFVATVGFSQNALHFDGVDDYVITPYNGLTGSSSRTVEAWIKPTYKSSQAVIVDMGSMASSGARFTVNLLAGKLRIEVGGNGKTGSINLADGNWHHIAITYNDALATNKYSMYVDGVLDGPVFDLTVAANTVSGNLMIGGRNDLTANFLGEIDEVRVWNTVRTQTELSVNSLNEFCTSQSGLVAYHKFNSGIAAGTNTNHTISIDDSGLGNNGILNGFALSGTTSNWVAGKLAPCTTVSCINPSSVGATNVYGTTADVYWTQGNTGSTFKLEYGATGFTLGQGTKISSTNDTLNISGLTSLTSYDVYVKELCSATDSSQWSTFSFTTGCTLINSFPFMETFDDTTKWETGRSQPNYGVVLDECWPISPAIPPSGQYGFFWGTRTATTGTSGTGPTTDVSGTGNYIYTESTGGTAGLSDAKLTTPTFDLSSLNNPEFSFQYHMYGIDMGTMMVWAWNGNSYDTLWSLSGNQGNAWNQVVLDLSNYKSAYTHLVFYSLKGASGTSDMAIDEVMIQEASLCPIPLAVQFDNITSNSARLNFTSSGTNFNVEYGPSGYVQGTGTTGNVNTSGTTITGLNPNLYYDFYLQNDCSGAAKGTSFWTGPFTIHTLCAYTNAYATKWDQLNTGESDLCWSFSQLGGLNASAKTVTPSFGSFQPFSGANYYEIDNSTSSNVYLISPEISDLDFNTLQVRFQAANTYFGSAGTPVIYVGTMASATDTASFTLVDTIETTLNNWVEFTVLLDNVTSTHKHVALRHGDNANSVSLCIDDLFIESIPNCIPPSMGVFSQIQDTSVVLNWLAGDASTWEIEYGVKGFTQGTGSLLSGLTDTNATINGLLPNTCFDVYIRGNCTGDNSPWYGPIIVCTECAVYTAPYLEQFESTLWEIGYSYNPIDPCWNRIAVSSYNWFTTSGVTQSGGTGPMTDASGTGKYVYTESSNGSHNTTAALETPTIDFSTLTNPALSFAYHMSGSTMGNMFVLISNGAQYDTIYSIYGKQQLSASDPWITAYVDLSNYKSTPRTIQFIGQRGTSYTSDMALDNVSIDEMPTCLLPKNFILDSLSATFADFKWGSESNGTNFKLQWGPAGFTQTLGVGNTMHVVGTSAQVSGLLPNTNYDIYLSDLCDSNAWVGPITFTTILVHDAELHSVISPSNLACGDSNYVVEVLVKNNGLDTITNLGIGANISGNVSTSITNLFNGAIAPGDSAIIPVGTINTYAGGQINIEAYADLSTDQQKQNDTLFVSGIEIISAVPLHYPVDTLCKDDLTGEFKAVSQIGIVNNWYNNLADVTPFAMGDTIPALPTQTVYLDRSKEIEQFVFDNPINTRYGNMFKIYVKNDINFSGFSFKPATSGSCTPIAFYKTGNWRGSETSQGDWTPIDSLTLPSLLANQWYQFNFSTTVSFNAGDTISIYIANKEATKMVAGNITSVNGIDELYVENADFQYFSGVGGSYFGSNMATNLTVPHAVSSKLHYTTNQVCNNKRVALTMGLNVDTAVADFNFTIDPNGAAVAFDASASNGDLYEWDFGDGNTATGIMATNTYASGDDYSVTLVVTDNDCGTTDTISKSVKATVGVSESLLNRSLSVYPNPNSGTFKVSFDLEGNQDVEMSIVNTVGKVVYAKSVGTVSGHFDSEITVDNLPSGIYFLRIVANGKPTNIRLSIL